MATKKTNTNFGPLLHALFARDAKGQTDGQLLHQFLFEGDQAAFAALVRRHGAMVLGVCRRVLANVVDAEDAFQATFLVLARNANSLKSRPALGAWLHGVARRTALNAKCAAARRRVKEQAAARPEAQFQQPESDWLQQLDEELSRLPEKYRQPVVLCDLEGQTRQQAARHLGWPEGTVAGRLARGRAMLAKRLLQSAQVFSGVAGAFGGGVAKAALPLGLVQATLQTAMSAAAGNLSAQSGVSAAVLTLTKGVLRTMFWHKMKTLAVGLLATVFLVGVGGGTVRLLTAQEQSQIVEKPGQAQDKKAQDEELLARIQAAKALKALPEQYRVELNLQAAADRQKALAKAAQEQYEGSFKYYLDGHVTVDTLPLWSVNWLKAELGLLKGKSEKATAHEKHLKRMLEVERITKARLDAGGFPPALYQQVVYYRIEAEIWLEEAKEAKETPR